MSAFTHLAVEQRYLIKIDLKRGLSISKIAKRLEVKAYTIYRELKRNSLHVFINILSGLLAYQISPKKPCMKGGEITKQSLLDDSNSGIVMLQA